VRRDRRAWPLVAYPYLYLTVFAVANPLLFRWYLSPPLPFYFLLILAGVSTVAQDLGQLLDWGDGTKAHTGNNRRLRNALSFPSIIVVLFCVAVLASTLKAWELHPDHGPDRPAPEMAWIELELLYARAADIVLDYAERGDRLCAGDIGRLGYATSMPILDTVGLVTPESRRHYPTDPDIYVTNYAIPADLVLALDPDFVVILEVYGRRGLLSDSAFQNRYRLIEKLETSIYGSDGMLVFERDLG